MRLGLATFEEQQPTSAKSRHPTQRGRIGIGVRRAFSRFYPDYTSEDDLFTQEVRRHLEPTSRVLDAGCGAGDHFAYDWKHGVRQVVGCDVSSASRDNPSVHHCVQANLAALPFANASFDVVFSRYVMEHVETPTKIFRELARVLKPGGKLIVLTPSKYHYVTLISRLTPHWFHESIARLRGNTADDVFPTKYLANCRGDLVRYGEEAGLQLKSYATREVSPNYLLWSLPTFLFGVAYERLVNRLDAMSALRVSIIAVFERSIGEPVVCTDATVAPSLVKS